jgi:hypothetical protein
VLGESPIGRSCRYVLNAIYIIIIAVAFRQHNPNHVRDAILFAAAFWGAYIVGAIIKRLKLCKGRAADGVRRNIIV